MAEPSAAAIRATVERGNAMAILTVSELKHEVLCDIHSDLAHEALDELVRRVRREDTSPAFGSAA
jgi:hypothetical protein